MGIGFAIVGTQGLNDLPVVFLSCMANTIVVEANLIYGFVS